MANRVFNIGEKVAAINELVQGTVLRNAGDKVIILCEDGFEREFECTELVKISKWDHWIGEPDPQTPKKAVERNSKEKEQAVGKVKEVDLHLHEITDHEKGLSNHDKLRLQLEVAERELKKAIRRKCKKIVFIHGRGQGVLRLELHRLLGKYPVEFHDASYLEYGQGATEVRIFQNMK